MQKDEQMREQAIQNVVELLRKVPFTFQFKVKKKPEGVKIIWEITQEHMNAMIENTSKRRNDYE